MRRSVGDFGMIRLLPRLLVVLFIANAWSTSARAETVVALWNKAAIGAVQSSGSSDLVTSRALAVVHRAMYDAWTVFDPAALGVRLDTAALRRPAAERTDDNKSTAVSYAAYRTLSDLFPSEEARFRAVMDALGLDPARSASDEGAPAGLGLLAADLELRHAHDDGANQLGDRSPGAYSDYSGYTPPNPADRLIDLRRHQPILRPNGKPALFDGGHWPLIRPFALYRASEFRPMSAPALTYDDWELRSLAQHVIDVNAELTDRDKAIAEFWTLGNGTPTPPGQFHILAQHISETRGHGLDQDIKMFFILGNALHDTAIAKIEAKMHFLTARPETLVRALFAGEEILAWGGRGRGAEIIDGKDFKPYRPTAAAPEHVSGHSAFGFAGAEAIRLATGSDALNYTVVVKAGSFAFDDGPANDVVLAMETLTEAARDIALSGIYGQAHFTTGDQMGRLLGRAVAQKVYAHAMRFIEGTL
ncbi:hypothetical protein SAMN05660686_04148 [Thalassobaculum litoreum DSM 18839]|uniref:PAP2 superfamily protein n=3 Tax=Thalassobaculaceae TaxID=2844864 RepID=A0A8G2EZR3_9PROT|nr:hypothetical protein SAMN05660686_04148 [Thalassobaculum litoreum DSM 18839]